VHNCKGVAERALFIEYASCAASTSVAPRIMEEIRLSEVERSKTRSKSYCRI